MYDLKRPTNDHPRSRRIVSVAEPAMYDLKPTDRVFMSIGGIVFQLLNQQCMI